MHLRSYALAMAEQRTVATNVAASEINTLWEVFKANVEAMWQFRPAKFTGILDVIASAVPPRSDPTLGWRDHAAAIRTVTSPGDHFSIVRGSNAVVLAQIIRAGLDQTNALHKTPELKQQVRSANLNSGEARWQQ
jgi:thioesterase domain-containing protein